MKFNAVLLLSTLYLVSVEGATSPPYQATAHHEQTFLDRRAIVPQSHADIFSARHQIERREYVPVPVSITVTPALQRREYIPVPVGFAKTPPAMLDRRSFLLTHVAAHHEPTVAHLERRAGRQAKKRVVKKVAKKTRKRPVKSLQSCINELKTGYPAYDNMREAISVYHHALTMFPEQLIADPAKAKEIANDITLGLQSARTYLTIIRMQTADDRIPWRKALVLGQASWLGAKIQLAMRLTSKVKPMPQLKWLEKVSKSVAAGLDWLWGKKETRDARKRQLSMSGKEKMATKNLKSWLDSAIAKVNEQSTKLTTTLCSRMLG